MRASTLRHCVTIGMLIGLRPATGQVTAQRQTLNFWRWVVRVDQARTLDSGPREFRVYGTPEQVTLLIETPLVLEQGPLMQQVRFSVTSDHDEPRDIFDGTISRSCDDGRRYRLAARRCRGAMARSPRDERLDRVWSTEYAARTGLGV